MASEEEKWKQEKEKVGFRMQYGNREELVYVRPAPFVCVKLTYTVRTIFSSLAHLFSPRFFVFFFFFFCLCNHIIPIS